MSIPCSRCGRCCIEFEGQIKFASNEPLPLDLPHYLDTHPSTELALYAQIKNNYFTFHSQLDLRKYLPKTAQSPHFGSNESTIQNPEESISSPNKYWFFIPSKRMVWHDCPDLAQTSLEESTKFSSECLFLRWTEDILTHSRVPECIIHGIHPVMCNAYPKSKGGVCKNHPEHKYSSVFLEYQRSKIGFAIDALRMIYEDKIPHATSYELLTLLMDFGNFSVSAVKSFFTQAFHLDPSTWQDMIANLTALQLISIRDGQMQGISLKEVEREIEIIMKSRHWA